MKKTLLIGILGLFMFSASAQNILEQNAKKIIENWQKEFVLDTVLPETKSTQLSVIRST
jgi:hypothetical protein